MEIGDREWIAVFTITQSKLALVVGTPELVGRTGLAERCTLCLVSSAFAGNDQAMSVQNRVNGAHRGRLDRRKQLDQFVPYFRGAPGTVLLLESENLPLDLEGRLVRVAIRRSGPVFQPGQSLVLVSVKQLISGFTGNAELTAKRGHLFAIEQAGNKTKTFIHLITLFPGHLGISPNALIMKCVTHVPGIKRHLCVGNLISINQKINKL